MPRSARVAYIWSEALQQAADQLPANVGRSAMVHDLVRSLDLLDEAVILGPLLDDDDKPEPVQSTAAPRRERDESDELEFSKQSGRRGGRGGGKAVIAPPDLALGSAAALKKYHDEAYVDFLAKDRTGEEEPHLQVNYETDEDGFDSGQSDDGSHTRKKRKTERYGLEHDCPPFPLLSQYTSLVAASTQTACRLLARDDFDLAINWDGGRHHAMRNRASGFCYVADAVLGIMLLVKEGRARGVRPSAENARRTQEAQIEPRTDGGTAHADRRDDDRSSRIEITTDVYIPTPIQEIPRFNPRTRRDPITRPIKNRRPRIMYLDLDLHYGDGVSLAFLSPSRFPPQHSSQPLPKPPNILTLSIHHSSPIFFPPPTRLSCLPDANTHHPFTLSLPLKAYASRATYKRVMDSCVEKVKNAFDPDYVVLQLGVDGLPADPIGEFGAWAVEGEGGVKWCVEKVTGWGRKVCVLGGGGYRHADAARAWATVTGALVGRSLDRNTQIPDHEHFPEYRPSFTLEVGETHAKDVNTDESLREIEKTYGILAARIGAIVAAHA